MGYCRLVSLDKIVVAGPFIKTKVWKPSWMAIVIGFRATILHNAKTGTTASQLLERARRIRIQLTRLYSISRVVYFERWVFGVLKEHQSLLRAATIVGRYMRIIA